MSQSAPVLSPPATSSVNIAKRILSFPTVLAASLTYLVFLFSKRNIADPDLWWHLRNAQELLTNRRFPTTDLYSYTAPGASVMPFEWLSELPYYFAYKWAGLTGVYVLVFLLSTAIILGVYRLSYLHSRDLTNSFMVSIGATMLASVSIGARTLLFGWLYLVILLLILEKARAGGWKWLWLVPPLFCLWVNSHGSWPMGMVVFGIFIASGLLEGSWGNAYATRWSPCELKLLSLTALASGAAVFLNPVGYRLVIYPFQVMLSGSGLGNIQEFASVDFHTPWGKVALALIFGSLLISVFSRERWGLDELALTMISLYYALTYIRFMFLAGILLTPIFAKRIKLMTPYERNSDRKLYNAVALGILLCVFVATAPRHRRFKPVIPYPEGAVAYMKANGIHSRVFNDWVWGGYLIWHSPETKVFIDGRGDPYSLTGVFRNYMVAVSNENPEAVFHVYGVEYVLMPADSSLAKYLMHSSAWKLQYVDRASVLFRRTTLAGQN